MRLMHMAFLGRVIFAYSITLMFQAVFVCLPKILLTPKRHRHQTRHIKRGASRGDRADDPQQPADGNLTGGSRAPEDLVLGPETAERNDAANRQPSRYKSEIGPGHV